MDLVLEERIVQVPLKPIIKVNVLPLHPVDLVGPLQRRVLGHQHRVIARKIYVNNLIAVVRNVESSMRVDVSCLRVVCVLRRRPHEPPDRKPVHEHLEPVVLGDRLLKLGRFQRRERLLADGRDRRRRPKANLQLRVEQLVALQDFAQTAPLSLWLLFRRATERKRVIGIRLLRVVVPGEGVDASAVSAVSTVSAVGEGGGWDARSSNVWTKGHDGRSELVDVEIDALSHREPVVRTGTAGDAEDDERDDHGQRQPRGTALPPPACAREGHHRSTLIRVWT